jgi:hypothetical protein
MKSTVKKLGLLAKKIAHEQGNWTLFALVLPTDTFVWDVLVAAEWIEKNNTYALKYIAQEIQHALTKDELLSVGGIVLLDNSSLSDSSGEMNSETGWEENNVDLFGRQVQKAYIFTAPLADIQVHSSLL